MSGICGIIAPDGSRIERTEIEALAARLERRGPDGTNIWLGGSGAALGHSLLATTPEALCETLPLTDRVSTCTITADVRLDNRDQLFAELGIAPDQQDIGDGELVLRAYLEWGDECPMHLLGDFAFAIWDSRTNLLFCARDQIGMRQLTYRHEPGNRFFFATEPAAIAVHASLDCPLNPDRVADFLGNMEQADLTSTMFRTVRRLPPAHFLKLDANGVTVQRYWQLALRPILRLPSDEAYAAAFLDVFTEAVSCRLRSARPVGAMLSGGIDSNAVVAVASQLLIQAGKEPLATFSGVAPDAQACVESDAIRTAMTGPGLHPTAIDYADLGTLRDDLIRQTLDAAEPFDATMVMIRAVYLAARSAGRNVVLDGAGSDVLLSSNFHTAGLIRRAKLRAAWRNQWGARDFWGADARVWRGLVSSTWQALAPLALRGLRFRIGRRRANRQFVAATRELASLFDIKRALHRRRQVQRRAIEDDRVDAATHLRALLHPNVVLGRERYDRVAAACGIEPRDPFVDLRLIDFCLSLPPEQRHRDGWSKWVLRGAMAAYLPRTIRWRRGKEHLGFAFIQSVASELQALDLEKRNLRPETIYLLNWFAAMQRKGWVSGTVTTKGSTR